MINSCQETLNRLNCWSSDSTLVCNQASCCFFFKHNNQQMIIQLISYQVKIQPITDSQNKVSSVFKSPFTSILQAGNRRGKTNTADDCFSPHLIRLVWANSAPFSDPSHVGERTNKFQSSTINWNSILNTFKGPRSPHAS